MQSVQDYNTYSTPYINFVTIDPNYSFLLGEEAEFVSKETS